MNTPSILQKKLKKLALPQFHWFQLLVLTKFESFYLKTKGDLEEEIKKLKFETINIFQPGHLAGRINWQKKKAILD